MMIRIAPVYTGAKSGRRDSVTDDRRCVHRERFHYEEFIQSGHVKDQAPRAVRLRAKKHDVMQAFLLRRHRLNYMFIEQSADQVI